MELFCAPKSSLDNPNLRAGGVSRSFCVMEDGEMDGAAGFSVEDDETGEVGFLPEFDDTFWTYDETAGVWLSSHFKGRKMRRGQPRKGGKGKGKGGRFRFRPRGKGKGKGKGKGFAHYGDGADTFFSKGKGKGKKGKKGKGKGKEKGEGKEGKGKGPPPQAHVAVAAPSASLTQAPIQPSTGEEWSTDVWWTDDSWWWQEDVWFTDDTWWTGDTWSDSAHAVSTDWQTSEWNQPLMASLYS